MDTKELSKIITDSINESLSEKEIAETVHEAIQSLDIEAIVADSINEVIADQQTV